MRASPGEALGTLTDLVIEIWADASEGVSKRQKANTHGRKIKTVEFNI